MSPRIYLRKINAQDEQTFTQLMRDSVELHEPWISPPTDNTTFRYYLQRINRQDHEGFAVCRKEDDAIVGAININNIVRGSFLSASLGYYVVAAYQGTGYMQEGLLQLIRHACSTMGLHRLEANIQPDNIRSQRLVERCGFVCEGLSRDFLYINGAWRDHQRWCYVDQRASLRAQRLRLRVAE
ncbi:MAG: GNAT family protein [Pseudomonadota bacterium]